MIIIKNLTKEYKTPISTGNFLSDIFNRQYKTNRALDDISFEIGENELVGFIGPNGAGKTTTMKILAGILYPTAGEVKVLHHIPFHKSPSFLKQIAFLMGQKNQLLWELPATDSFKLNKAIYEISDNEYKKSLNELVELLDCKEFVDQPVKTLSLGQRMRVELIASLLNKPKVLFLDEPTIGLDIFAQSTIINFIKEYQERHKATVIFTSHYMKDVETLAKRVILIDKGKIIFDGAMAQLVNTFSQEKTITITLGKPINIDHLHLSHIDATNKFPLLSLTVKREKLNEVLNKLLQTLPYIDVTVEDEPIEEIIKKSFKSGG